jgi:hypothetical protein
MSKPYDAVTKRLIEMRPEGWVAFLDLPPGDVSLIDADLSTITSYADRIIRVDTAGGSYLVHNELESGKDTADLPLRLFHYNSSTLYKMRLPVVSTVFLLHKGANSPRITGTFEFLTSVVTFTFRSVTTWCGSGNWTLTNCSPGGIATLPFAPIANVAPPRYRASSRRCGRGSMSKLGATLRRRNCGRRPTS